MPAADEGAPERARVTAAHELLLQAAGGEKAAEERLLALTYGELHRLAQGYLARERRGHTLQPTALVHEAWLKLFGGSALVLEERRPFLLLAAQAMRRVLVDHARTRAREKRGGGRERLEIDTALVAPERGAAEVLEVDEALARLRELSERQAQVVELRFFGGLEVEEVAVVLAISTSTAEREWRAARAFLHGLLGDGGEARGNGSPRIP